MFTAFAKPSIITAQDRDLVRLLEKIREKLEVSRGIWSEYLGLQPQQYEKILHHREPLTALSLYHISERLCLNPSAFETGKIDYTAMIEAHRGNRAYLNPDYQVAASSRKFTVINTMNFVEKFRGKHLRVAANRHLQVHEDFWSDWENPSSDRINIKLLGDLWSFLRSRGLSDEDFRAIGFHSVVTHRNTYIGEMLSSLGSPREVYDYLINDLMDTIERNHIYRITRLTNESCIIESRSNPDIADALRTAHTGSTEGCQVKIGLIASMPTFVGQPAAAVHETHCVHRGDASCIFFCDFSKITPNNGFGRRLSLLT